MRHLWTEEERKALERMYSTDMECAEIASVLGVSLCAVYRQAVRLGLKKPEVYRSLAGKKGAITPGAVAHRFKRGHAPANKGKKMPKEVYDKVCGTMFKPGNTPVNYRPVGSERVNADGYIEIKVAAPDEWKLKHRVVWEKENGAIPRGCNIQFRNGNRKDLRLDNLYLIDRKTQLLQQNSMMARYPVELQQVIRAKGALNHRITTIEKKTRNEQ
jgi:hypothetical protein|nr:MAG TPA: homing endonuclease [Caudoviricetes sp.]